MALLPRYAPQSSGFGPKKILAPIFFENFDILFSKAETARPDAPGKKIDLAPHSMLCLTSKYEEKFYFRSIETIFFPSWGLKRLLEPFFHISPRFLHFLPFLSRFCRAFHFGIFKGPLGSLGTIAQYKFLVDAEKVAFHVNIGTFMASWRLLWRAPVAYWPPLGVPKAPLGVPKAPLGVPKAPLGVPKGV